MKRSTNKLMATAIGLVTIASVMGESDNLAIPTLLIILAAVLTVIASAN